jgi:hypothetical protein
MDQEISELCKAKFILNALRDGWAVKMNEKNELEFTKEKSDDMKKNNFSQIFLDKYGKIDTNY